MKKLIAWQLFAMLVTLGVYFLAQLVTTQHTAFLLGVFSSVVILLIGIYGERSKKDNVEVALSSVGIAVTAFAVAGGLIEHAYTDERFATAFLAFAIATVITVSYSRSEKISLLKSAPTAIVQLAITFFAVWLPSR